MHLQHLPTQPTKHTHTHTHTNTPNEPHTRHHSLTTNIMHTHKSYSNVYYTQILRHHITSHHTFIVCFGIDCLVHFNVHGLCFCGECLYMCLWYVWWMFCMNVCVSWCGVYESVWERASICIVCMWLLQLWCMVCV